MEEILEIVPEIEELPPIEPTIDEQLAELSEKYLRILAEYDNFRKRTRREQEQSYQNGFSTGVLAFLPVLDNINRATAQDQIDKDGIDAIAKQISTLLEQHNLTRFGESGDSFDPNFHNAIMHGEDEELGKNIITDVFQCGYKHGDRVIRHALVRTVN